MADTEIKIVEAELQDKYILSQIAGDKPLSEICVDGQEFIDRTKLFLVVQAKASLNRIIKLTNFLEKMENKFMETADNLLEDNPNNINLIATVVDTLTNLLSDSRDQLNQIIKDDKLQQVIINTTNIITTDGNSATIIDADSRDAIRNMAASLLTRLSQVEQEDVTVNEEIIE